MDTGGKNPVDGNYDTHMQGVMDVLHGERPRLLLHCCCAPCASVALERLEGAFDLTLFFDNPNMDSAREYERRADALKKLAEQWRPLQPVVCTPWEPDIFYRVAAGFEEEPERGRRCTACISLRLARSAAFAAAGGFDYMATTLTVGPRKDATLINRVGEQAAAQAGITFLLADFKKRGGFQRSVALSREYGLYRQNYCGCVYSRRPEILD